MLIHRPFLNGTFDFNKSFQSSHRIFVVRKLTLLRVTGRVFSSDMHIQKALVLNSIYKHVKQVKVYDIYGQL